MPRRRGGNEAGAWGTRTTAHGGRGMRLVTYLRGGGPARAGVLLQDARILDLAGAGQALGICLPSDLLAILDLGPYGLEQAAWVADRSGRVGLPTLPRAQARLMTPVPQPRKMIAV